MQPLSEMSVYDPKVANAPEVKTWEWPEERPTGPVVKPGSLEERVMNALIDQAVPPGGERKKADQ